MCFDALRYNKHVFVQRIKIVFSVYANALLNYPKLYSRFTLFHFASRIISLLEMSSNNPENPYVFNKDYYENTTHVIYKETIFYYIHRTSFILSALFSFFLIGLIVFLIIFKTPKSFKPYSTMLLIYAITDLYLALGEFLIQPVSFHLNTNDIEND